MRITVGRRTISIGVIAAILGVVSAGVFAAYILTLNIPLTVHEPIEILDYTQTLNLYPGETVYFNITVQNHASLEYILYLNFSLDSPAYQQNYVTTSNDQYLVQPGVQILSAWLKVSAGAPSLTSSLAVGFSREAVEVAERVNITNMTFQVGDATHGSILLIANNTGTSVVTINEAWVNNVKIATMSENPALPQSIAANTGIALNISIAIVNGYSYQVKLISAKGNTFLYTATAPS